MGNIANIFFFFHSSTFSNFGSNEKTPTMPTKKHIRGRDGENRQQQQIQNKKQNKENENIMATVILTSICYVVFLFFFYLFATQNNLVWCTACSTYDLVCSPLFHATKLNFVYLFCVIINVCEKCIPIF